MEENELAPEFKQILNRVSATGLARSIGEQSLTTCKPSRLRADDLARRGIYARYQNCTFEEIERRGVPPQVMPAYQKVREYRDALPANLRRGEGLVFKGPPGTMKTTLAVVVLRYHLEAGGSGFFIPMVSLLDTIFTLKEKNREEWVNFEERIRQTGLLVLDDLGSEGHSDWVLAKVDAIISERYNRMRPIIITTNLSDAELRGKYAERVIDRLRATSTVINLTGKSLRKAI